MKKTSDQLGVELTVVNPLKVLTAVTVEFSRIYDVCLLNKNNEPYKSMHTLLTDFWTKYPLVPGDAYFERGGKQSDSVIQKTTSPEYFDDLTKLTQGIDERSPRDAEAQVEVNKLKHLVLDFSQLCRQGQLINQ